MADISKFSIMAKAGALARGQMLLIAAAHESLVDAVDRSSTGTSVPWMWALLRLPRIRGASQCRR